MVPGILGKKIGMTQIFTDDGIKVPVTVIEAGPCQVQAVKTTEKDGYNSVQLGYQDTRESRVNKPQRVYAKAKGLSPKKFVREIRCEEDPGVEVGAEITNKVIQVGDFLDIVGTSKGKGFQGGVRRHGWRGGVDTHGSMSHRAPGSIGQSSYPSRVFKGLRMAGHMGNAQVTVQNLEVVVVNPEDNTIAVKGAVPGANGTFVIIRYAKKKALAERVSQEEEAQAPQADAGSEDKPKEGNKE